MSTSKRERPNVSDCEECSFCLTTAEDRHVVLRGKLHSLLYRHEVWIGNTPSMGRT